MSTPKQPDQPRRQERLVRPWPEYDETDESTENETVYLFELESSANDETTCDEITAKLNARFGNHRTSDEVQDRLRLG